MLEIAEVGAGGGSLVTADRLGTILVGPQSAGAVPGPACYAAGGTRATVTDANVVLGFINPTGIAGGTIAIYPDLARRAIQDDVAAPLGISLEDAAWGVFGVAAATMTRAVKAVTTYRGRDPRDFVLLAFGGNGPIFATALAELLGIRHVRVPAAAGVFSALGLLEAEETWHYSRSLFAASSRLDAVDVLQGYRELEAELRHELSVQGTTDAVIDWGADMRYADQGYDLTIDLDRGVRPEAVVGRLRDAFHATHLRMYGHASPKDEVELVNIRVTGRAPRAWALSRLVNVAPVAAASRSVWLGPSVGRLEVPIVGRADVRRPALGPLLIEEFDTTTVVPPDWRASLDDQNTIVLEHVA